MFGVLFSVPETVALSSETGAEVRTGKFLEVVGADVRVVRIVGGHEVVAQVSVPARRSEDGVPEHGGATAMHIPLSSPLKATAFSSLTVPPTRLVAFTGCYE